MHVNTPTHTPDTAEYLSLIEVSLRTDAGDCFVFVLGDWKRGYVFPHHRLSLNKQSGLAIPVSVRYTEVKYDRFSLAHDLYT